MPAGNPDERRPRASTKPNSSRTIPELGSTLAADDPDAGPSPHR